MIRKVLIQFDPDAEDALENFRRAIDLSEKHPNAEWMCMMVLEQETRMLMLLERGKT